MNCRTDALSPEERKQYEEAKQQVLTNEERAAKMGITVERLQEMQAYAAKLRRQHPQFTEARLQRKVGEYFKIKFV